MNFIKLASIACCLILNNTTYAAAEEDNWCRMNNFEKFTWLCNKKKTEKEGLSEKQRQKFLKTHLFSSAHGLPHNKRYHLLLGAFNTCSKNTADNITILALIKAQQDKLTEEIKNFCNQSCPNELTCFIKKCPRREECLKRCLEDETFGPQPLSISFGGS